MSTLTLSRVAAGQYAGTDETGNTWSVFRQETASGEGYGAGRLWLWCNDATGEHSDPLPTKAAAADALNAYLPGRTLDETWGWVYREPGEDRCPDCGSAYRVSEKAGRVCGDPDCGYTPRPSEEAR